LHPAPFSGIIYPRPDLLWEQAHDPVFPGPSTALLLRSSPGRKRLGVNRLPVDAQPRKSIP
jgi:hypothetical protein